MDGNVSKNLRNDYIFGPLSLGVVLAGIGCSIASCFTLLQDKLMLAWSSSSLLVIGGTIMAFWAIFRLTDQEKPHAIIAGVIGLFSAVLAAMLTLLMVGSAKNGGTSMGCFIGCIPTPELYLFPAIVGLLAGVASGLSAYHLFQYAMEESLLPANQAIALESIVVIGAAVLTFAISATIYSLFTGKSNQ